jgi:hypothetical protein
MAILSSLHYPIMWCNTVALRPIDVSKCCTLHSTEVALEVNAEKIKCSCLVTGIQEKITIMLHSKDSSHFPVQKNNQVFN